MSKIVLRTQEKKEHDAIVLRFHFISLLVIDSRTRHGSERCKKEKGCVIQVIETCAQKKIETFSKVFMAILVHFTYSCSSS